MGNNKSLEERFTDTLAGFGPWLAPIPSAAMVSNAMLKHFVWVTEPVAMASAVVVELLGLTTASTALTLYDYNAQRSADEPRAPFWLAAVLVGVYFASTIALTVIMEIVPGWMVAAPALFPILALVGTVNIALRRSHAGRVKAIADRKAEQQAEQERQRRQAEARRLEDERKAEALRLEAKADAERKAAERKAERAERKAKRPAPSTDAPNDASIDTQSVKALAARREKYESNLQQLLDAYRVNRELGPTDAATLLGVSRETIYNYKAELAKRGHIHENGNGLEVLA